MNNVYTRAKIIFLSIFFISPVFVSAVYAQPTTTQPVLIAQVNIENAKIEDQVGNTVGISFLISNREGVQSGVRYSVRLTKKGSVIPIDELVYPEVLQLGENTSLQKSVLYTAPAGLSGVYTLSVFISNDKGFPFGLASLGDVTFTQTTGWLSIAPETCTSEAVPSAPKAVLPLSGIQTILGKHQTLSLTCTVTNGAKTAVAGLPVIKTFKDSVKGEMVSLEASTAPTPISFKANESKKITVTIPFAYDGGMYVATVALTNGADTSNTVQLLYRVQGVGVDILQLSLNKDGYNKKDTAVAQVVWRATGAAVATVEAVVKDGIFVCGRARTPVSGTTIATLSIPMNRSCVSPAVTVTLKDADGTVLAEKTTSVETLSGNVERSFLDTERGAYMLVVVLALVAVAALIRKKKMLSSSVPPTVLLVLGFFLSYGLFATISHAQSTYTYSLPYTVIAPPVVTPITVTLSAAPSSLTLPTDQTLLTWSTTGTPDSCTASNAWSGVKTSTGGNETITGLTAGTYQFDITCVKAGTSNAFASAVVVVSAASSPSGTLLVSDCLIPQGQSTCATTIFWTTANLTGNPTAITRSAGSPASFTPSPLAGGSTPATVEYGATTFYLYHNAVSLAQHLATASCTSGTVWNGSTCELQNTITALLTANPTSISSGGSSTLTWTSNGTSCSGSGFNTGGAPNGSTAVSPAATTTYTVLCTGPGGSATSQATVTVGGGLPACSDGADNDGDGLIDQYDPGCHTDGDASNALTYDPADTSEFNRRRPLFNEF